MVRLRQRLSILLMDARLLCNLRPVDLAALLAPSLQHAALRVAPPSRGRSRGRPPPTLPRAHTSRRQQLKLGPGTRAKLFALLLRAEGASYLLQNLQLAVGYAYRELVLDVDVDDKAWGVERVREDL